VYTIYVAGLSEKIRLIGNNYSLRTVFSSQDTIRSRLVNFKPRDLKSNKDVMRSLVNAAVLTLVRQEDV
jgi:hypothetical protein